MAAVLSGTILFSANAADSAAKTDNDEWPFVIIRCFGTGTTNDAFLRELFAANERHHGLVEEIWYSGGSLDGEKAIRKQISECLSYREKTEAHGIRFSFQQGLTLNHSADFRERAHFTDEVWSMDEQGTRYPGLLCPTSPEALDYTRREAELFMEALRPVTYWPDDDLRFFHKGSNYHCFCPRCMKLFNERYHHDYSREELAKLLFDDSRPEAELLKIRTEWTKFNAERLAAFAAVFREAADKVAPECRLGIQAVFSSWNYDGPDFQGILSAFSGAKHAQVGIRPGALYFTDKTPHQELLRKSLEVMKEAARCSRYGYVGQVCVETENYPHVGAQKNPAGQMMEASLMIAAGADSTALYWGADCNRESDEFYHHYFELLARWKPFFRAIRDTFKGAMPSGVALYRGGNQLGTPEWLSGHNEVEFRMMENGYPMSRQEADPEVYALDERAVRELAEADLENVFAKPVMMDIAAFRKFAERFPKVNFTRKVELKTAEQLSSVTAERFIFEVFEGKYNAMDFTTFIRPVAKDVEAVSGVTAMPGYCGTCIIPTEFGQPVLLVQEISSYWLWTGYRREAILNALDRIIGGAGMSARVLTNGFSLAVIARRSEAGKTVGCYVLNLGLGETMPLELAIRNPASKEYALMLPGEDPVTLKPLRESENEMVFALPELGAWKPLFVMAK